MLTSLRTWFGPTRDAIRGYLSISELSRCLVSSAGAAVLSGSIVVTTAVLADVEHIVKPELVSVATFILTLLVTVLRRMGQGAHVVQAVPDTGTPPPQNVAVVPAKVFDVPAVVVPQNPDSTTT